MLNRLLISLFLILLPIAALAETLGPIYDEAHPVIHVNSAAPNFTIQLISNPSTGFSWFLQKYDERYIVPLKHYYTHAKANVPGAPHIELWLFAMTRAGIQQKRPTLLHFVYARPWEKVKPAKEKTFKIVVGP